MKLTKSQLKKIIEEELNEIEGARIPSISSPGLGFPEPPPEDPAVDGTFAGKAEASALLQDRLKSLYNPGGCPVELSQEEISLVSNVLADYLGSIEA